MKGDPHMAGKKKGFSLGGLVDAAKAELFESDDGAKAAPQSDAPSPAPQTVAAAAAPPPVASGTIPYTFGTTPAVPEPLDPKVVEMVSSSVFVDLTEGTKVRPSRYMLFSKMWQTLGNPADARIPLAAMQVSDPTISGGAILQDIDAHLTLLDVCEASANTELDGAAGSKLGGADQELLSIQQANEAALREIERHQKEIAERSARASTIQTQRATDEANITRAKARTKAAVDSIRAQLQGARALFASIT